MQTKSFLHLVEGKAKMVEEQVATTVARAMWEYKEFKDFTNSTIKVGVDAYVFGFADYWDTIDWANPELDLSLILVPEEGEEEEVVAEEEFTRVDEAAMPEKLEESTTGPK